MSRRARLFGFVPVALCVFCAVGVGVVSGAKAPSGEPPVVPDVPETALDGLADRAVQEAQDRQDKLQAPGAVADRRESRTAFSAFDRIEAKDLAKETFGDVMTGSRAPTPRLDEGERVERYIGDEWALIDKGKGEHLGFVRSMVPMLAEDASGKKAPVDLDLEGSGSVLKPANPLVDIDVERDASQGARLSSSGFGVRPVAPMAGKSELQVVAGEKAFWAGVDADTDYLVSPVARGFESDVVVRSEDAPEQFSLGVDLPQGSELRDLGDQQGLEVVDPSRSEKDQALARMARPAAWDADGTPVAVTYAVEESTVVLRYPHRERDLHYPLLVDPVFVDFYGQGEGIPYPPEAYGWQYGVDFPSAGLFGAYDGGLTLAGYGGAIYDVGRLHGWYWTAPGDSFIYRADFPFVTHTQARPSDLAHSDQVIEGIWDPRPPTPHWNAGDVREPPNFAAAGVPSPWSTTAALSNKYKKHCQIWVAGSPPNCSPGMAQSPAGTPGNMFIFQEHWPNGGTATNPPLAYLDGAIMELGDFTPPSVNVNAAEAGKWTDDTNAPTHSDISVGADDGGLGVNRLELDDDPNRVDNNGDGFDDDAMDHASDPCTGGLLDSPCSLHLAAYLDYQTRPNGTLAIPPALPEGIGNLWARGIDILNNVGQTTAPVRIDRSGPTVALSGPLQANASNLPATDQNLHINVTDGTRGGSDAQQRSGVDRVDVLVDGKRVRRFDRHDNEWLLLNASGAGPLGADVNFRYGNTTQDDDMPIVGDWNGDGKDTAGVYRQTTDAFRLRNSNSSGDPDLYFGLYGSNDIPVAGDWNDDGTDTIGVYRPSNNTFHLRNSNTTGSDDITVTYGIAGDIPVVGDWDGNGTDTIGVYRPGTASFLLKNTNTGGSADVSVAYGVPSSPQGDLPVVGDWDGNGTDTIGVFRRQTNTWLLRNTNTAGSADVSTVFGTALDPTFQEVPVPGDFDGDNKDTPGISEQNCTGDSCPMSRDWTYHPSEQYGDPQTIQVVASDRIGHKTTQTINVIRPTQGKLVDPVDGARTAARLPLQSQLTGGGATTTKFQYRRPLQPWTDVPSGALTNASNGLPASCSSGAPLSCTVPLTGGLSPALTIDFMQLPTSFVDERSGSYEIRAVFPALGVTKPSSVIVDERGLDAKDAQASIGPGSVDLVTGNFSYASEDVSWATPGSPLVISRTFNSRDADGKSSGTDVAGAGGGPFGPGWVLTGPVADAGADFASLRELPDDPIAGRRIEVLTGDGSTITFSREGQDWDPEDGYESYALTKTGIGYEVKDSDANTVEFKNVAGSPATQFVPISVRSAVAEPTSSFKVQYAYELSPSNRPRVKQILAPTEAGITCTLGATQPGVGCRALNLTYAASTTATPTALGSYIGRLKSVEGVSTVYSGGVNTQNVEQVALYSYDNLGRLREQWDPRISQSLKETYTYDSAGHLLTITPPGENAWSLTYQSLGSGSGIFTADTDQGRLKTVSRTGPQGLATTTMAYRVGLTAAAGGPYAMSKTDIGTWGQQDYPIDATAIFPPNAVPATPPASYLPATVHYVGRRGLEVNAAAPGGGRITTTEYDAKSNVTRTLSATNRQRVLGGASATQLDTQSTYSADGLRLVDELGPAHSVKNTQTGAVVSARAHTVTTYDEGAPVARFGEPAPNLPTTVVTGAKPTAGGADFDTRTHKTEYDWKLRKPTAEIVDPNGLNLKSVTVYDKDTGRVTETRTPAGPGGGDAHATRISYNSGTAGLKAVAGLPDHSGPAAQPAKGLPDVPTAYFSYNRLDQTVQVAEGIAGSDLRKVNTTYDGAGRQTGQTTNSTVSQSDLVVSYNFDEGTGTGLADRSGNGNFGSISGATWVAGQSGHGQALSFDGVDDKVTIPDSQTVRVGDSFTFEAWLKPSSLPANTSLYFWGSGPNGPSAYLYNAKETLRKGGVGDLAASTGSLSVNQWAHVAFTKNGATTKLYIDGQDVTGTVSNQTMAAVATGFTLGSNGTYNDKFFPGLIDDVRIYNRALGASEILDDRNTPVSSSDSSTITSTIDYSPTTGRPTTTTDGSRTVTTAYDNIGRVSSYTDADSNTTQLTYDLLNRPVTINDVKGTQTRTYDPTTGFVTGLSDTQAGSFSATYGQDGQMLTQTYPGGIRSTTTYDETGSPTDLTYVKTTNCSSNCTWFSDSIKESIHGQWATQTSSLSQQAYGYDAAGRLTTVNDTVGGQCTTRVYGFDADSNRLSKTTRNPGAGGACQTTGGTTANSTYDSADRLTNTGTVYDPLGRIASVPASHSGGGILSTTYYPNDMVRSQTQDNATSAWLLDPTLQRHRATLPNAGNQQILHYSDSSDSPAWTEQKLNGTTTSWSRNIEGIDGGLAATYDSQTAATTLQLTNLHGDVIATATNSSTATGLSATFESDEFGNPRSPSSRTYGWLGGKQRRTQLASGVIQMGVRSYVPAMGRFTSVDPVRGGSANRYDYTGQEPLARVDLSGLYYCPWIDHGKHSDSWVTNRPEDEYCKQEHRRAMKGKRPKDWLERATGKCAKGTIVDSVAEFGKILKNPFKKANWLRAAKKGKPTPLGLAIGCAVAFIP
jgi:RHS repeat-associated protein